MTCDSLDAIHFAVLVFSLGQLIRAGIDLWYAWRDWEDDL